jgi:hypothetical protein
LKSSLVQEPAAAKGAKTNKRAKSSTRSAPEGVASAGIGRPKKERGAADRTSYGRREATQEGVNRRHSIALTMSDGER